MSNRFLEKVAATFGNFKYQNFYDIKDTLAKRVPNHSSKVALKSALGAGAVGAGIGYSQDEDATGHKLSTGQRIGRGLALGTSSAILGGILGNARSSAIRSSRINSRAEDLSFRASHNQSAKRHEDWVRGFKERSEQRKREYQQSYERRKKQQDDFYEEFKRKQGSRSGNSGRCFNSGSRTVQDLMNDMDAPTGGFKTKAEATKHYKRMVMKHHPDRGGDVEKMKKINKAFDDFKAHPDGFEKLAGLANIYLEKVAQYL